MLNSFGVMTRRIFVHTDRQIERRTHNFFYSKCDNKKNQLHMSKKYT